MMLNTNSASPSSANGHGSHHMPSRYDHSLTFILHCCLEVFHTKLYCLFLQEAQLLLRGRTLAAHYTGD